MTVPPRIAQNPIGISSLEMGKFAALDILLMTGRNNAVAPTFCINPEMPPTVDETTGMTVFSVFPPTFKIPFATAVITPVRSKPAPNIMTAMMAMTALDANPSNK